MKNADPLLTFAEKGESNGEFTWTDHELGAVYIDLYLCICPQVMLIKSWKKRDEFSSLGMFLFL